MANAEAETYGRLTEGLHVTGYSFERACTHLEWLLEDNRWQRCGDFSDVNQFLGSLRFDQFRPVAEARKRIATKIKALQPEASNRQIAATLGVGRRTIDRDTGPNGPTQSPAAAVNDMGSGPNGPRSLSGEQAARAVQRLADKGAGKRERRQARERDLAQKQLALPQTKFGVIYADPPWRFEPYSRETGMDRAADNHYPTMTLDDLKAMTVPAADDCVLFLWATVPMLPEAIALMSAWDFAYKSNFVWLKDRPGTGYWNRNRHEHLLIGTRGNIPAPAPGDQYESVINAVVQQHSAKPFHFREIIENMFPTLPRVELFARESFVGWHSWGNEVPNV